MKGYQPANRNHQVLLRCSDAHFFLQFMQWYQHLR